MHHDATWCFTDASQRCLFYLFAVFGRPSSVFKYSFNAFNHPAGQHPPSPPALKLNPHPSPHPLVVVDGERRGQRGVKGGMRGDGRRETRDERWETGDKKQGTGDGKWETGWGVTRGDPNLVKIEDSRNICVASSDKELFKMFPTMRHVLFFVNASLHGCPALKIIRLRSRLIQMRKTGTCS